MAKKISIQKNVGLNDAATDNRTSTVGEPSVAAAGDSILMTGNWYASSSTDGGSSWSHIDPFTFFPPASDGFCCDQLTLFDTKRGIWIWILQYIADANGTNVFRIAITDQGDFPNRNGWHWWDIAPAHINSSWTDVWFDYPDAAVSANYLYVTFNVFKGNSWQRAVVMRFKLDELKAGGSLGVNSWNTNRNGSLRLTQQAEPTDEMYFASHIGFTSTRVFSWPESSGSVNSWDVPVDRWSRNISSRAPNGVDWLARCDNRITGGSLSGDDLTFMWTSGAQGNRRNAFIRVVVIDKTTMQVTDNPDIRSSEAAWAYPAVCANTSGEWGITAFYGGGSVNPGAVVGARDTARSKWIVTYAKKGSNSPAEAKWGDYLNCRADYPGMDGWVASGFTLQGGSGRSAIEPRVVRFSLTDEKLEAIA